MNDHHTKCPGPHWSHPDMFRVPPRKWPVSDLSQNSSCDTSNHIRMQKQVQWKIYKVRRTTLEVRAWHSKPEVKGSILDTVNVSFVRLPWSISVSFYLPHSIRLDAMERHRKLSIEKCGSAQRSLS